MANQHQKKSMLTRKGCFWVAIQIDLDMLEAVLYSSLTTLSVRDRSCVSFQKSVHNSAAMFGNALSGLSRCFCALTSYVQYMRCIVSCLLISSSRHSAPSHENPFGANTSSTPPGWTSRTVLHYSSGLIDNSDETVLHESLSHTFPPSHTFLAWNIRPERSNPLMCLHQTFYSSVVH